MAGDTVTTIFGGDDSQFAAAAGKVKSLMGAIAGFQPEMKFFEAGKKGAQGLEAAAHGAAGGIHAITAAFGPLAAGLAVLAGVGSIFAGIKKSIDSAAGAEENKFKFEGIAGGATAAASAIAKLREAGHETATGFGELSGAAKILIEAGMSADDAADSTERLQKIALNTGGDLNELAEIYGRVTIKEEISQKDLAKLAMSGIPGIAEMAHQFKELERATSDANKEIEANQARLERTFELNEKNIGGINSFANRIGLTKDAFAAFANGVGVSSAVASDLGQGFTKIAGTLGGEFTDGLKQISKETGVSQSALLDFAREGKLGYDDLIQAAARFRKEEEDRAKQAGEEQKLANENNLLQQQRGLVSQVSEAIKGATDPGGIFATVNKFFELWNGKLRELTHSVEAAFVSFGTPLIDALKPALDYLNQQGPAIKEMAKSAGEALGGAIKWFIDSLRDGTFWDQVKSKGAEAFDQALQPVRQLGAQLQQAFAGLNKNGELVEGFKALSKLLDAIADGFGIRLLDAVKHGLAELDVSVREWASKQPFLNLPGHPEYLTPEQQQMTHQGRVMVEESEATIGKTEREKNQRAYAEAVEGVKTHFPAALRQGMENFQTPPDISRAREDWTRAVSEGRTPFYVKPEQAARDYERQTGQKQPQWMSPETAERIAQLLEAQNGILRAALSIGGGG